MAVSLSMKAKIITVYFGEEISLYEETYRRESDKNTRFLAQVIAQKTNSSPDMSHVRLRIVLLIVLVGRDEHKRCGIHAAKQRRGIRCAVLVFALNGVYDLPV